MKRDNSIIKIFFSTLSCMIVLLLCGCPDTFTEYNKELHPLQTPADDKDARIIPPGTGNFILVIDGFKNGRTIMPGKPGIDDISEFKLVFSGGAPIDPVILNKNEIGTPINLDVGSYTLTVLAYKDSANDPLPTATGVLTEITITEGQTITAAVKLDLYTINGGTGFFAITLSGAVTYNLKINSLISGGTLVNVNNPEDGYTLISGYYLVVVTATDGSGKTAVRSDVLHIYNNLRSEKTYTFAASDFIPNLSGTVTISDYIIGGTLSASVTDSNASGTFRYQWYKNGNPVGSNSNTYGTLTASEIGDEISVRVIHNTHNGSITGDAVTVVPFLGGEPFQIKNETQLKYIAVQVNAGNTAYNTAEYQVMNNITLTENWTPIGTETNPFAGYFDGGGYTISNLTITGSTLTGFFGHINNVCFVENLHLQIGSAGINGTNYTGGIAGKAQNAYIDNCSVSGGSISTNNQDAGGIAGYVDRDGVIHNCYTTSNVISTSKNSGGIAGTLYVDASINNCYAAGTISGSSAGGIAGDVYSGGIIKNCVALNPAIIKLSADYGTHFGRIAGFIRDSDAVGNKARSDMLLNGFTVTGTAVNKDGQEVTVGTGTTLASVFADFDTAFWDIPSGSLVVNGALPTLRNMPAGTQNPRLLASVESPNTTLNSPDVIADFLSVQSSGDSVDNPIYLKVEIPLGTMTAANSGWQLLLNEIAASSKYVVLDMSDCEMPANGVFNPNRNVDTGKEFITAIILPDGALTIPNGVSYSSITFRYFTNLTSISGEGITSIDEFSFSRLYNLKEAHFPSATSIGADAFSYCTSLTSISFPSATSIGADAFTQCTSLTSISFPAATTIASNPFIGCSSLTNFNLTGSGDLSVLENGKVLVRNTTELVAYPSASGVITMGSITSIGEVAFGYCTSLTSVSFPVATTIGGSAFSGCTSLTSVSIPAATSIGIYAFSYTGDAPLSITLGSAAPAYLVTNIFQVVTNKNVTVQIPNGATGYSPATSPFNGTQAMVTGTDTTQNWANALRGLGWDGTNYGSGTVNTGVTVVIVGME